MEKTVGGKVTGGAVDLDEVLGYSCASVEYAGLVLFSYIRRGGVIVLDPVERIASPVWSKAGAIYGRTARRLRDGLKKVIGRGWDAVKIQERLDTIDKRLSDIEGSLATNDALDRIEKRLAYLEKYGIMASKEGGLQVKGKKLTDDRLMMLKTIVKENIDIMEGE
ncbi:MAG: hypothetical protein HQL09_05105 [Nitrospirae bacterium]|nr:hypothetical protein [Nitrospirota bacterium]